MPKGVPLSHAGYLWATGGYDALRAAFEAQATIIAAPLFHMNGLFSSKLLMRLGGTNILMTRFQAQAYLRAIHRHRCTALLAVPTMLALIARESAVLKEVDLTSIRQILVGSAPSFPHGVIDPIGLRSLALRLSLPYPPSAAVAAQNAQRPVYGPNSVRCDKRWHCRRAQAKRLVRWILRGGPGLAARAAVPERSDVE